METIVLVFVIILLILYTFWKRSKGRCVGKFPPGPPIIPFVGNLVLFTSQQTLGLLKLRKQYGDIYSIRFGTRPIVVLNTVSLLRKAFSKKTVTGRPIFEDVPSRRSGQTYGITFATGQTWAEQRSFFLKSITDDVNALPPRTVNLLHEGIKEFAKRIANEVGKPVNVEKIHPLLGISILWSILTGKDKPQDNEEFLNFAGIHGSMLRTTDAVGAGLYLGKIKLLFPWLFPDVPVQTRMNIHQNILHAFEAEVELCIKEGRNGNDNFMGRYLNKIQNTTDQSSSFYGETGAKNLIFSMFDSFTGTTVSVSYTFSWLCLMLSMYPKVQDTLFKEIKQKIGLERLPNLDDKEGLPYTRAIVLEVLRYAAISSVGGPRTTSEDVELEGYLIPAGTLIFGNLYAMLHDPEVWKDPQVFRPERFLSSDGQTLSKEMMEYLVPFSVGRRYCPAERFVKDIAFLLAATVFQKFKVKLDPDCSLPEQLHEFKLFVFPTPHKVIFEAIILED